MKKIFWLIILIITWYIISIFLAPTFADKIADLLWIQTFNEQIRWNSWKINKIATDIPTAWELQDSYNNTIKNVKDWIDKTKSTIDDVRATLSWAENTYNKAKDIYNETSETVNKLKDTLNDVDKMREKITGTVNTEIVK